MFCIGPLVTILVVGVVHVATFALELLGLILLVEGLGLLALPLGLLLVELGQVLPVAILEQLGIGELEEFVRNLGTEILPNQDTEHYRKLLVDEHLQVPWRAGDAQHQFGVGIEVVGHRDGPRCHIFAVGVDHLHEVGDQLALLRLENGAVPVQGDHLGELVRQVHDVLDARRLFENVAVESLYL